MHKFKFWRKNYWLAAASFCDKIQIIKLKELVLTVKQKKKVNNDFNEIHSFSIRNYQFLLFSKIKKRLHFLKLFQASFVKF